MGNQSKEFGQLLPPPQKTEGQSLSEKLPDIIDEGLVYAGGGIFEINRYLHRNPGVKLVSAAVISSSLLLAAVPDRVSANVLNEPINATPLTQLPDTQKSNQKEVETVTDIEYSGAYATDPITGITYAVYRSSSITSGLWYVAKSLQQTDGVSILEKGSPLSLTDTKIGPKRIFIASDGKLIIEDDRGFLYFQEANGGFTQVDPPYLNNAVLNSDRTGLIVTGAESSETGLVDFNDPTRVTKKININSDTIRASTSSLISSVDNPNVESWADQSGINGWNKQTNTQLSAIPWKEGLSGYVIYQTKSGYLDTNGVKTEIHLAVNSHNGSLYAAIGSREAGYRQILISADNGNPDDLAVNSSNNTIISARPDELKIYDVLVDQTNEPQVSIAKILSVPWDINSFPFAYILNADSKKITIGLIDIRNPKQSGVYEVDLATETWSGPSPLDNTRMFVAGVYYQTPIPASETLQSYP